MSRFSEYVTSGAFSLSLSRRQVEMISHIDQLGYSWGYLSTCSALIEKGMVERIDAEGDETQLYMRKVVLTEAGRAMVPLLKLAGLYVEIPKTPEPEPQPDIKVSIRCKTTGKEIE